MGNFEKFIGITGSLTQKSKRMVINVNYASYFNVFVNFILLIFNLTYLESYKKFRVQII